MKISTEALTRVYNLGASEIAAVNNVTFQVEEGAFTAIIGRSGSGKTTLLNLVGLNDDPSSGRILIDEVDVSSLSKSQQRKIRLHRMGFVFQSFNLLPTINALENVQLPMAFAGKNQQCQREKGEKLLKIVGLAHRASHRPKELSMGEMQRVAIARALANDPETIIADEPTGELDTKTAKEIIALLTDISKSQKRTVVVATHDEKVVETADNVYRMEDGKLAAIDSR